MKKLGSIATVLDSSFLYDTKAMYETDQNRFLNAVCRVETDLSPTDFLLACKKIEKDMGRVKTYRWGRWGIVIFSMGPRVIDLTSCSTAITSSTSTRVEGWTTW